MGISLQNCSMFNIEETNTVINYISKLLANNAANEKPISQSDIGVTSPYKLQCKHIARACLKNGFDGVTIGSAEVQQFLFLNISISFGLLKYALIFFNQYV